VTEPDILPFTGERPQSLDAALTVLLLHEWRCRHSDSGHYTVSIIDRHESEKSGTAEANLTDALWSAIRKLREGLQP
jgi:hypothetical protein